MTDENKNQTPPCSPDNECSPSCCPEPKRDTNRPLKWGVFISVMVLALFVGAYSLIKKNNQASEITSDKPFISESDLNLSNAEPDKVVCGETLTSLHQLNILAKEKNVAFILLPGKDENITQEISNKINQFVNKVNKPKNDIVMFTMSKNAEGFDKIVTDFGIQSYPSVIVLGRGCRSSAITQDFNENKFLGALSLARMPMGSCKPGDKCPSPCDKK